MSSATGIEHDAKCTTSRRMRALQDLLCAVEDRVNDRLFSSRGCGAFSISRRWRRRRECLIANDIPPSVIKLSVWPSAAKMMIDTKIDSGIRDHDESGVAAPTAAAESGDDESGE